MTEVRGTRPRLLFLGDALPYPPDREAAIRSYHLLRLLAGHYDVDALFFHHRDVPTRTPLAARVEHVAALARVEVVRVPAEWSPARRAWDGVRGVLSGRGEGWWRLRSATYRRRVLELLFDGAPRVVHVASLRLFPYLPLLARERVVMDHARVESEALRGRGRLLGSGERKRLEGAAGRAEELARTWLPQVALNLASSEEERDVLASLAPGARVETVPNGVDTGHFRPSDRTGHGLIFVGDASSEGNRVALKFFADEILSRIRREIGVQGLGAVSWVATASEPDRVSYRLRGVDITGYVEDVRPLVRSAGCYIAPIPPGGGGGVRVLEAWAMGKAVVSTSAGCAGLDARDGENVLVRDDPAEFARAVVDVLETPELARRLGEAGRRTVEAGRSWSVIGERLLELYAAVERSATG